MSRTPLIAGNWKMNGRTADIAGYATALRGRLAAGRKTVDVLVCPPAPYLAMSVAAFAGSDVMVGGQDCHAKVSGAHTGDVAASMLKDIGCGAVIVGHSERRADHGESDATVLAKAMAAQEAGLIAIICVGEGLEDRKAGRAEGVVSAQLAGSLPKGSTAANTVVAYEPVWAIGSGLTPSVEEIAAMHARIRSELTAHMADGAGVRILYGGSVKPANSGEILGLPDVDGVLVGGASLKADDFAGIVETCP